MLNWDDFQVLTFDCYGTLIDWEAGIWAALRPVLASHHVDMTTDKALELYGELESDAERGPYVEYKAVLGMVLQGFGGTLGFVPTQEELQGFSESVKDW